MKLDELVSANGDPDGRNIFKHALAWGFGILLLIAILGGVCYWFDTASTFATQKVTMQKEAYVATFNGANKLAADKDFNSLYNTIVATGHQIATQQAAIDAFRRDNPDYSTNLMLSQQYGQLYGDLVGTKQMLQSQVGDYNTKANALQTKNFLPVGYLASINPDAPPTTPIN